MLIPDPKTPHRSEPTRTGRGGARRGARRRHPAPRVGAPAGLAGLDAGAARRRGGIKGVAADRTTGIGGGAAARHLEGLTAIAGLDARAARHHASVEGLAADRAIGIDPCERHGVSRGVAGIERLPPWPVVRRIGIDEGACRWQVYLW